MFVASRARPHSYYRALSGGLEDIFDFEGSLGFVQVAVALAPVLIKLVAGLFAAKNPSPQQLAEAQAKMQGYIEKYANVWASGDRLSINEIKSILQFMATSPAYPAYYHQYATAALQVINQHDAQNPTPPQYTGPLILGMATAPGVNYPLYTLPKNGVQTGAASVQEPDGSTRTVPTYDFNKLSGPDLTAGTIDQTIIAQTGATGVDHSSGVPVPVGGGATQAGILGNLGGMNGLLILAAVGTVLLNLGGSRAHR